MKASYLLFATLAVMLGGCSANIAVNEVKPEDTTLNGMPFRVAKPYIAHVFRNVDGKYVEIGHGFATTLPDKDHLYVLQFNGATFSNGTVELALNEDDTIKSVHVKSTSTGQADLTAAGTQLSSLATALNNAQTTSATNRNTVQDAYAAYVKALITAQAADRLRDNPPAGSSPQDLASAALLADMNANQLAVRAGVSPVPYPDVPFTAAN